MRRRQGDCSVDPRLNPAGMSQLSASDALDLVRRPGGMDAGESTRLLDLLVGGGLAPEQSAAILVALAKRGETAVELAAFVTGLLARAIPVPLAGGSLDPVGTGGSGLTRYNVSTTAAFIAAAAGVPIAKHGNRGSARSNGSFDFLEALGVPFQLPPDKLARLHAETGVCFLFARAFHPAIATAAPARKLAAAEVKRTIFNLAGPLANPARPTRRLIGACDERIARLLAETMAILRVDGAVVVSGHPGIDEVSVTGATLVWEITAVGQHHRVIAPAVHHGIQHQDLPGGDATTNAALFQDLIHGRLGGPLLDMVLVNAGVAIDAWHGRAISNSGEGLRQARELVENGTVARTFAKHREVAQRMV